MDSFRGGCQFFQGRLASVVLFQVVSWSDVRFLTYSRALGNVEVSAEHLRRDGVVSASWGCRKTFLTCTS